MHLGVEPAGGERKSAEIEWKMVTLIYPYPNLKQSIFSFDIYGLDKFHYFDSLCKHPLPNN
jgi:hypothetical protein